MDKPNPLLTAAAALEAASQHLDNARSRLASLRAKTSVHPDRECLAAIARHGVAIVDLYERAMNELDDIATPHDASTCPLCQIS